MKGHLYTVSSRNAFESVQERWTVTRSGVCGPSRNFSHPIVPVLMTDTTGTTRESINFFLTCARESYSVANGPYSFFCISYQTDIRWQDGVLY
jgi:hypothetical protein